MDAKTPKLGDIGLTQTPHSHLQTILATRAVVVALGTAKNKKSRFFQLATDV